MKCLFCRVHQALQSLSWVVLLWLHPLHWPLPHSPSLPLWRLWQLPLLLLQAIPCRIHRTWSQPPCLQVVCLWHPMLLHPSWHLFVLACQVWVFLLCHPLSWPPTLVRISEDGGACCVHVHYCCCFVPRLNHLWSGRGLWSPKLYNIGDCNGRVKVGPQETWLFWSWSKNNFWVTEDIMLPNNIRWLNNMSSIICMILCWASHDFKMSGYGRKIVSTHQNTFSSFICCFFLLVCLCPWMPWGCYSLRPDAAPRTPYIMSRFAKLSAFSAEFVSRQTKRLKRLNSSSEQQEQKVGGEG